MEGMKIALLSVTNQGRRGMLFRQMETYISECIKAFPMIRFVVFSSGICSRFG